MRHKETPPSTMRRTIGLILLNLTAGLIVVGGLYDLFLSQLPAHLNRYLGNVAGEPDAMIERLVLALLDALGGSLVAVGLVALVLINRPLRHRERWAGGTVLMMVGLAEGANAWGMWTVAAPWRAPLTFIGLTAVGIALAD